LSADTFRVQYGGDGQEVNTTLDQAMRQDQAPAAPAPKQTAKMKILYNTETGETTVQESRPTGMNVAPAVEKATARNAQGMPVSLSNVGPRDVVTLPNGLGDSTAETWEQLGMLRRLPGGMGYEVVGEQQQPQSQQAGQKPAEKKADETPGDPTGVDPTSPQTDQTLSAIESKSPAALEGLVTSLSQTGEVSPAIIADMARTHGVEPAQMQASVDALVADHTRAARQAIARVDSSIDPDAFQAWLLKSPELADKVTRDVMGKSVREVQNAAREYVKNRDGAIESALVGKGIETQRLEGKLYMSRKALGLAPKPRMGDFPASDWIAVDEAVRAGHLTING
jgi:hypothetical protein